MTRRAMDFIREAKEDGRPWCLHLSYIKPHWPYIAPAPYHDMFSEDDVQPAIRSDLERQNPHPVYGAFMDMRVSRNFAREEVRRRVIPPIWASSARSTTSSACCSSSSTRRGSRTRP